MSDHTPGPCFDCGRDDSFQDSSSQCEANVALDRHPNSQAFHDHLTEAGALHDQKQKDYGRGEDPFANVRSSTDWGIPAWVGAMIRLNDKVKRLQSLAITGELANEGAVDSFMDIAVYAIIALVLFEEETRGEEVPTADGALSATRTTVDFDGPDAPLNRDPDPHAAVRDGRSSSQVLADPGNGEKAWGDAIEEGLEKAKTIPFEGGLAAGADILRRARADRSRGIDEAAKKASAQEVSG